MNMIRSVLFFSLLVLNTEGSEAMTSRDWYCASLYRGNYIWSGAMNLAWNELCDSIIHAPLQLNTNDKAALQMITKFNTASITKSDLDTGSYYVKSGFGQKTIRIINEEVNKKFPDKSFEKLPFGIESHDLVAYAYFLKKVAYMVQFEQSVVSFENKQVKGFHAVGMDQRNTVKILKYDNDNRFIISLRLKDDSDELICAKGFEMDSPRKVIDTITAFRENQVRRLSHNETFAMPKLHCSHKRSYSELVGKKLANENFTQYRIGQMFENIRFDLDHEGARVESEAVIVAPMAAPESKEHVRNFILDKPFWVIMIQKHSTNPYFIMGVNNTELMYQITQ